MIKEQLEYLPSLSFTWSDVAALLGVSRSTIIGIHKCCQHYFYPGYTLVLVFSLKLCIG